MPPRRAMKLSSMPSRGGSARKEYDPLEDAHLSQHFKNPKVFQHLARAGLLPVAAASVAAPGDGPAASDASPAAARRAAAAAATGALTPSLLSSSTLSAADPALQLRALEADAATLAKEEAAIRVRQLVLSGKA